MRAFGIAGEYSFALGPISDPELSRENANFAQRALTKGYWGAREFRRREFMLRSDTDTPSAHYTSRSDEVFHCISDLTLSMMINDIRISVALNQVSEEMNEV